MVSTSSTEAFRDRFGRQITYLRVSVTDRCNFRCTYCMPAEGIEHVPRPELLTFEEIEQVVRVFAETGVSRVRLTGGEPLVRANLPVLVAQLKAIPGIEQVVMTTNAFLLERYAERLAAAGLDGLNISLDSLDPETFAAISRVGALGKVLDGIESARAAGLRVKLNAVVMGGVNDREIVELVSFAASVGAVMRFIEFMPIGTETAWGDAHCVPAREMRERLAQNWELVPDPERYGTGPARYWRAYGDGLGPKGCAIGFISAVTECFCADCNRVRITPQGGLRACLADDHEVDLRVPLRTIADPAERAAAVRDLIHHSLWSKKEAHAFDIAGGAVTTTRMHSIGG